MQDYKNTPKYQYRQPKSHVKGFAIAFVVMLGAVYMIVYFADYIDTF